MNYIIEGENLAKTVKLRLKLWLVPFAGNDFKPRFLQSNILLSVVALLLFMRIVSMGFFIPWPQNFFFADITKIDLVNLLNQNRQDLGLNTLNDNQKLDDAAMLKAKDMVANDYFAHQSPAGVTPWHWFNQVDYKYKYAGENLAVGFVDSAEVFDAWLNSPKHKANLQNPNYKDVGTAVLSGFGDSNATIVVQEFGSLPVKTVTTVAVNKKPIPTPAPVNPVTHPAPAPVSVPALAPVVSVQVVSGTNSQIVAPASQVQPQIQTKPKVLGQSTAYIQAAATQQAPENGMYYDLVNFIAGDYQNIILYFSYVMLLAVSLAFLVNMFANMKVLRAPLLAKSLLMIGMLYVATFVNQSVLLQLLPHTIKI